MNTNLRATLKYDDINIVVAPTSHTVLSDRDAAEQHPISAITGLQTALDNKADVGEFVSETDFDEYKQTVTTALANKADTSDLAAVATTGDYDDLINKPTLFSGDYNDLVNKPDLSVYAESADLAAVATSGDYDDLTDKPDLSVYAESADLAAVATSGNYTDLANKPTIPTAVSQLDNDSGFLTLDTLPIWDGTVI